MELPQFEGFTVQHLIGVGGCGGVFLAVDAAGRRVALKSFNADAIHVGLLERMTRRLGEGEWPEAVLRVEADFSNPKKVFWTMPLLGDGEEGGESLPRCLQHSIQDHPNESTWDLVKSLAAGLAQLHQRRVVHGNVKPGNVFFREDGGVLLSDWALGNMPGIARFGFTDAILYQAPEQLREPGGYLEGEGYGWDVFAFGVLAYRLLTGRFPRCHDTFHFVAPPPGKTRKEGIQADLKKVARNLEGQSEVTWPMGAGSVLEGAQRGWIQRCLELDPMRRPLSMIEVANGLESLDRQGEVDAERERLLDQRRRAEGRASNSLIFAAAGIAAAVLVAGVGYLCLEKEKQQRVASEKQVMEAEGAVELAVREKKEMEMRMKHVESLAAYERELGVSRLEASREVGDFLFEWAMEEGRKQLPALDGRETRLKRLEAYFEEFLRQTKENGVLFDAQASAMLQLAEVSLSLRDASAAARRLGEAADVWQRRPLDEKARLRLATNWLRLALLRQSVSDPEAGAGFVAAREALGEVPRSEAVAERLDYLLALLDLHESKLLSARGDDAKALEQLLRATQTLNRIVDHRPDLAVLRSELAGCYLSSAAILDGIGNSGDAQDVRELAGDALQKALGSDAGNLRIQLELAGCYAAMAESAILAGDVAVAEKRIREGMEFLDGVLISEPENVEGLTRRATLLGLRAGVLRDRGFAGEAMDKYNEGIRILEGVQGAHPQNGLVSYRLALLWWQKGRMIGVSGDRSGEIGLIQRARALLGRLETDSSMAGVPPEQVRYSTAYLLGDLGHGLQLEGDKDGAAKAFMEAAAIWEKLKIQRPEREEYGEALSWCQQRLNDLK